MRVLLLNGPPGVGKDEVVLAARAAGIQVLHRKFARPLRIAVCAILGIDDADLEQAKRSDPSVRELMIAISEQAAKPILGQRHFGFLEALSLLRSYREQGVRNVIISDCGFAAEVDAFTTAFSGGPHDIQLWQIQRPGCSYDRDSRNSISVRGVTTTVVENVGSLQDFKDTVTPLLHKFFSDRPMENYP